MLLFWFLACASAPDVDADGAPDNADCAPENPLVAPTAAEVCNGVDDDCDGQIDEGLAVVAWYRDADGDGHGAPSASKEGCRAPEGYAEAGDDCDDADPWAFPGAVEVCDGVDQDCDGAGDDGAVDATPWYADADGDGFGDAATELVACTAGAGWAAEGGDCDDTRADVSPAGVEVCGGGGGVDEDCDGQVDAEDPDVQGASVAYPDADGDGWGGEAAVTCDRNPGSAPPGDCDDADPTSYPGGVVSCDDGADHDCDGRPDTYDGDGDGAAGCVDCDDADGDVYPGTSELCNGHDDDCDGETDEADAVDANVLYQDADHDGFGDPAVLYRGCSTVVGYVSNSSDCDDLSDAVNPSAEESCRTALDDNCDGLFDAVDARGCTNWYVDADEDGFGDADTGLCQCEAPSATGVTSRSGDCDEADAAVHPDAADACGDAVDADCDGDDNCRSDGLDVVAAGDVSGGAFGYHVGRPMDVTGDAVDDLVVSTHAAAPPDSGARIFAGPVAAGPMVQTGSVTGRVDDSWVGSLLDVADVNGDGIGDLALGTDDLDYGGLERCGGVYLLLGPLDGDQDTTTADLTVVGGDGDGLGWTEDMTEDLDGDGAADLVIGGLMSGWGAYCGWRTDARGVVGLADASWCVLGDRGSGIVGHGLDAGDLDGDGVADLAYGEFGDSAVGWMAGPLPVSSLATDADGRITTGRTPEYFLGVNVRILPDVDGDGAPDLLVATESTTYLYGRAPVGDLPLVDATVTFPGTRSYDDTAPAAAVDLDGDGATELILGVPEVDEGSVLVFAGPWVGIREPMDAVLGFEGGSVGAEVVPWGDVDGGGAEDLLVGGTTLSGGGVGGAGAVLLLDGEVLP